ncbi:hypothetical protein LWI28_022966 [Acer negundo]|uniref:Retrotransposon gag domain-containing protein n=1 Tax=Acer negundo TaxID=4023 RepID=A0AAD5IGY9_ACENE|nr:hypothetical protein LWI28_022966 [Acer negundo]
MLEQEIIYVSWEDFKYGINSMFGPNQYEDLFRELIKLRQRGSIVDYESKLEKLLAKTESLAPKRKVSCFVMGLKDSIHINVQANRPTILTMAIGLVKLFEAWDLSQQRPISQPSQFANPP